MSVSYVCAALDAASSCTEWAQTWSVTALSYADGATLASAILACWAVSFAIRLIFKGILNKL